jgi:integrase
LSTTPDIRITARLEYDDRAGKVPKWRVKMRTPAGPRTITLGGRAYDGRGRTPAGAISRKKANDLMEDLKAQARRGGLEPRRRVARIDELTLADLVDAYLTYVRIDKDRRKSTLVDYRNTLRYRVMGYLGEDTPARDIRTEDIERLRLWLLDEVSRRTAQKALVITHGMFAWAARKNIVPANPVTNADRVSVKRRAEFAVLSPAEVLEVARHADSTRLSVAIITAAFTGLRMGELRALRWRDVDFANDLIHVRRSFDTRGGAEGLTKSSHARSVPMIERAARALDELSRVVERDGLNDLVFGADQGGIATERFLREGLYEAMEAANVSRDRDTGKLFVFHDLRHSFGTLAVRIFPLTDVKTYMGHSDISTTMLYVHHVPQTDAAAKLGKLVEFELSGVEVPA